MSKTKLNVNEIEIVLYKHNEEEYISLLGTSAINK